MVAPRRVVFVDLLRVIATLQMVQGHTVDALLDDSHRVGDAFQFWQATRGLTAVAFLVAAGMAFYLTTLRDFDRYRLAPARSRRRFGRAVFLIGLGYVLHAPLGAITGGDGAAAVRGFLLVDVLQCIGVTLLIMEGCVVVAGQRWRRTGVLIGLTALTLGLVALAPAAQRIEAAGPWLPAINYLHGDWGRLDLSLFPWSAHMLAGALASAFVFHVEDIRGRCLRLLVVAAGCGLLAESLSRSGGSPLLVDHLGRFASVLAVTAVLALVADHLPRAPWLTRVASETLFIYVFHLVIAYGHGVGLESLVGHRLSPAEAGGVAAFMLILSVGAALAFRSRAPAAGLVRATTSG